MFNLVATYNNRHVASGDVQKLQGQRDESLLADSWFFCEDQSQSIDNKINMVALRSLDRLGSLLPCCWRSWGEDPSEVCHCLRILMLEVQRR